MTFAGATPWTAATELLLQWSNAGIAAPHLNEDDVYDEWLELRRSVEPVFRDHPRRDRLSEGEGAAVDRLADAGPVGA